MFAFLILRNLELFFREVCKFLKSRLIFNTYSIVFWMFVNKLFAYLTFTFKENFPLKSKWSNFIASKLFHSLMPALLLKEGLCQDDVNLASEIASFRFPRKVFLKRKLLLIHLEQPCLLLVLVMQYYGNRLILYHKIVADESYMIPNWFLC